MSIELTDVIELRNLTKWLKRELQIFKNDSQTQEGIYHAVPSITYLAKKRGDVLNG